MNDLLAIRAENVADHTATKCCRERRVFGYIYSCDDRHLMHTGVARPSLGFRLGWGVERVSGLEEGRRCPHASVVVVGGVPQPLLARHHLGWV